MISIDRSVITDAGSALINSGNPINITSVKTGSGTYTTTEDIAGRTGLKSVQNSYAPSSVTVEDSVRTVNVLITNYDPVTEEAIVTTTYRITEIGLFATVNDSEILFAIGISYGGAEIPAYTGTNKAEMVTTWTMTLSSTQDITVTSTGAAALATDFQAFVAQTENVEGDLAEDFAPAFSEFSTYALGALVTYNKVLYKCTTAVSTAGAWTGSTNWTPTTVKDELHNTKPISEGGTGATDAAGAKTNLGLNKVGNFKAVSTEASQGLDSTEQANARANIGAGTSSFSGSYNDLSNKPTLGTAAAKNSATSVTNTDTTVATPSAVYSYTRPVVITSSGSSAPSDTRSLWVYPDA